MHFAWGKVSGHYSHNGAAGIDLRYQSYSEGNPRATFEGNAGPDVLARLGSDVYNW